MSNPKTKEKVEKTNLIKYECKSSLGNKDVIAKRNKTNEEKFGHKNIFGSEYGKQKIKNTNKELYDCEVYINSEKAREQRKKLFDGSISPFNLKENRDKSKKSTFETYGVKCVFQLEEFRNKAKESQTKIKKGYWIPDDQLSELQKYRKKVWHFTRKTLNECGNELFGEGWKQRRGRNKEHLDHKYSILEGFKQNMLPQIIGSKWNLQLLTENENISKGVKCSVSKEELIELFEKYNKQRIS